MVLATSAQLAMMALLAAVFLYPAVFATASRSPLDDKRGTDNQVAPCGVCGVRGTGAPGERFISVFGYDAQGVEPDRDDFLVSTMPVRTGR